MDTINLNGFEVPAKDYEKILKIQKVFMGMTRISDVNAAKRESTEAAIRAFGTFAHYIETMGL